MFCRNCGKEIPENVKFCNYCGAVQNNRSAQNTQSNSRTYGQQQAAAHSQPEYTVPHSSNVKKKNTKKKVGIVLVCLQLLMLIGGISSGTVLVMLLFMNVCLDLLVFIQVGITVKHILSVFYHMYSFL